MTVRLLVTSVGSLVGQNILEGLAHRRAHYRVVGLNSEPDAVSNFLCDRVYLSPGLQDGPAFARKLDEVVAAEAPDLVVPGRDDDVVWLARWAEVRAVPVLAGGAVLARQLRDKRLTADFAQAHGLPFVPTLVAEDGEARIHALAARHGWPLVAKPRTGHSSRGVVLVGSTRELAVALTWPGMCFQPWLGAPLDWAGLRQSLRGGLPLEWSPPGIAKTSLDGCITPQGDCVAACATQHHEVRLGRSERVERLPAGGEADTVLQAYARALAAAGWRGPFNVQLGRAAGGELLAFELNGRFTGSAATLRALGVDFVAASIAAFAGPAVGPPDGVPVRRVDKRLHNWPLPDDAVEQLRQAGVWDRPV